ncbi:MAG: hypothetical protein CL489_03110 [Acidobacteria bacterium]|nr:hypothetical protein [Acidobacteriota bacterium]|tara:strand:+ start:1290 stop:1643 length:354 start_codon:yes stop_codon:yes gene_type:complete
MKSPFEVAVAGVTFRPRYPNNLWEIANAIIQVFGDGRKTGQVTATLVREPDNEHDPNAIQVFVAGEHIGYIPAQQAAWVANSMDAGEKWGALVDRLVVSPDNPEQPGLRIKVSKDES